MPQFMVAAYIPDDFDPSTVTEQDAAQIHALNAELEASGMLKFACGVSPVSAARTLRPQSGGKVLVTDGPYTETKEHIGGLLLLEAADMETVLAWARKNAAVARSVIEVRELVFYPDAAE